MLSLSFDDLFLAVEILQLSFIDELELVSLLSEFDQLGFENCDVFVLIIPSQLQLLTAHMKDATHELAGANAFHLLQL